jgi:hypothetical protein
MKKLFSTKKRIVAGVVSVGLLAAAAGGAYASFEASGSGTGSATVGSLTSNLNISDSGPFAGFGPGVPAVGVTVNIGNPNSYSVYVTNLTVTLNPADPGVCNDTNYQINGTQYAGPVTIPVDSEVAAGTTDVLSNEYSLAFYDIIATNQNGCQGQSVSISYSSN